MVWKTPVGKHNGHDEDGLLAMRGETSKLPKQATVYPGIIGGVIAPMAASKTTLFVPVVNHPLTVENGETIGEGEEIDRRNGRPSTSPPARKCGTRNTKRPPSARRSRSTTWSSSPPSTAPCTASTAKPGGEVWTEALPAGSNSGMIASGDTLIVPAGIAVAEGQQPSLVAFRLGG